MLPLGVATLLLIRHGPSANVPPSRALAWRDVERWRVHYDAAGLKRTAVPPRELVQQVHGAEVLLASDLPRARESAELIAKGRTVIATPLLREASLRIPRWPTRLPFGFWGALIYLSWKAGTPWRRTGDSADLERVRAAAAFVGERIALGSVGVAITHGVFRALLASELKRSGWRETARRGGYGHWSAWTFSR